MSTSVEVLIRLGAQAREFELELRRIVRAVRLFDARMPKGRLRKARRWAVVVALARRDRRLARRRRRG